MLPPDLSQRLMHPPCSDGRQGGKQPGRWRALCFVRANSEQHATLLRSSDPQCMPACLERGQGSRASARSTRHAMHPQKPAAPGRTCAAAAALPAAGDRRGGQPRPGCVPGQNQTPCAARPGSAEPGRAAQGVITSHGGPPWPVRHGVPGAQRRASPQNRVHLECAARLQMAIGPTSRGTQRCFEQRQTPASRQKHH